MTNNLYSISSCPVHKTEISVCDSKNKTVVESTLLARWSKFFLYVLILMNIKTIEYELTVSTLAISYLSSNFNAYIHSKFTLQKALWFGDVKVWIYCECMH